MKETTSDKYVSHGRPGLEIHEHTKQSQLKTAMDQSTQTLTSPTHPRQPPSGIIIGRILVIIIENATAAASSRPQPRPHTLATLQGLRVQLLQDPFFDPEQRTEELVPSTRHATITVNDMLVLLARLRRVLMWRDPLTEAELCERVGVRNACLDQPFFERARIGSERMFARSPVEDEGCGV